MVKKIEDIIVFEDEHFCFINKPAHMLSIPPRQDIKTISIWDLAHARGYYICHRLDRETSGIMVLAKTAEAHRQVSIAFENKKVQKNYHAICNTATHFENTVVDLPLKVKGGKVLVSHRDGKDASTTFNTITNFSHFSIVDCQPHTGRQHQIRVHLQSQNCPIVADTLYGGIVPRLSDFKKKFTGAETSPLIQRFALHAKELKFNLFNTEYNVESPYEKDISTLLKIIEKWDN